MQDLLSKSNINGIKKGINAHKGFIEIVKDYL